MPLLTVYAYAFFGEKPTWIELGGSAIVYAGLLFVTTVRITRRRNQGGGGRGVGDDDGEDDVCCQIEAKKIEKYSLLSNSLGSESEFED